MSHLATTFISCVLLALELDSSLDDCHCLAALSPSRNRGSDKK